MYGYNAGQPMAIPIYTVVSYCVIDRGHVEFYRRGSLAHTRPNYCVERELTCIVQVGVKQCQNNKELLDSRGSVRNPAFSVGLQGQC